MINFDLNVRRHSFFWQELSAKMVEAYLKELQEMKGELKTFNFLYEHSLFGSRNLLESLNAEIDKEIRYCEFFNEYQKRRETDSNLDKWILTEKENIKPFFEWKKPQGEQWTKTNGRIKAIIQFDRSGLLVKITLEYESDSSALKFRDSSDRNPIAIAHVKADKSIARKVEELKAQADAFMQENLFPLYETVLSDLTILKKLLCISQ